KDHALKRIGTIMTAAGLADHHLGPSQFMSMPAVVKLIEDRPLCVCPMDEFGSFMKRINSKKSSEYSAAITGLLRSLWGTSFDPYISPQWAGRECTTIYSPAMSIYGVSTPQEFYGALQGDDVINGVLNRFLIIETKIRPKERDPLADPSKVPDDIAAGIK